MSITISTTIGNVTLKEQFDGYEAGIDLDGPYINKQYLAPTWDSVFPVINALRGTVAVSGGIGGVVTRSQPHLCPESPNLYCLDARCTPLGENDTKDSGRPSFRLPIISCSYRVPKYEIQTTDDPGGLNSFPNESSPGSPYVYAMQSIDFSSEVVPVPNSAFKFTAPTLRTNVSVVRTVGVAKMVFVRKYVPYLPFVNITSYLNRVNLDTFFGQAEGTIRFDALRTRREYMSDGTRANEIELHFTWREYDHNKFMRDDDGTFDFLYTDASETMYKYKDLKPLLTQQVK